MDTLIKHICLPSKHRVWLPSRQTQISKHCSSRLKNKTNLRKRSWVWIVIMHCKGHKLTQVKSYSHNNHLDFNMRKQMRYYYHPSRCDVSYIWSERVEVRDKRWNRHDMQEERPQQVVREMCSDNRPETHQDQKHITLSATSQK